MSKGLWSLMLGGILLSAQTLAWTQGDTGGEVDLGGTIEPTGPVNPWEVQLGTGVTGIDMVLPEGGVVTSHILRSNIPVLGIRTTTGIDGSFGGESAGGLAPQVHYGGLVSGRPFDKGRVPVELDVKGQDNKVFGWLRLNLLVGAEVSQLQGEDGSRYSVYAGQSGQAFFGGIARKPDEAMDNALQTIGDAFPFYVSRYNLQGIKEKGVKQPVEFRNSKMQYSGFYGAGLVFGDEVIMRLDEGYQLNTAKNWKAKLSVEITYK
ncbi:hypothetical protein JNC30_004673 [Salmonella enterica]|nr:hypothetical protein [Salmonella enterica]EGM3389985.1 hypothetical protein [Salmonella enterica]EHE3387883.1 hypothetical protein [Salmonella enterica]